MKRSFEQMNMQVDTAPTIAVRTRKRPASSIAVRTGPKLSKRQRLEVGRIINKRHELKYFGTLLNAGQIGNNSVSAARMDDLSLIPQGDGDSTRDGDRIFWAAYFSIRGLIRTSTTGDLSNRVRFIMFQWKPNSTPVAANILLTGLGGIIDIYSHYSHDYRQDYTILWDETFNALGNASAATAPVGPASQVYFTRKINLKPIRGAPQQPFNKPVQFAAGGTTGTNKIWMYLISDTTQGTGANQPVAIYSVKVSYRDG